MLCYHHNNANNDIIIHIPIQPFTSLQQKNKTLKTKKEMMQFEQTHSDSEMYCNQ